MAGISCSRYEGTMVLSKLYSFDFLSNCFYGWISTAIIIDALLTKEIIQLLLSFTNNLCFCSPLKGHDSSIRLWSLETKTCIQEFTAHRKKFDESIHDVAFHPSKCYIASAGADALAKVFV